ncbi:MAG: Gfo/Idh/MocA family protein [Candidatus Dormibacteraceae bacterium]
MTREVGVGIIGMGLMGTFHSRALREVKTHYPESSAIPKLIVCADEVAERAAAAAARFEYSRWTTRWDEVIADPAVEAVIVCSPNTMHLSMATAALRANKHVFCEKPVGATPEDTAEIADAAASTGLATGVGYVYRWAPMVQLARELIDAGRLGEITNYRGRFLVGYGSSPNSPLTWRFDRALAGYGALGDLMSHVADMAMSLAGPIVKVSADIETVIRRRPLAAASETNPFSKSDNAASGEVTNDDYVAALVHFRTGGRGIFEVSRVVNGPDCEMAFDVAGTRGAMSWNFERMNELRVRFVGDEPRVAGWQTILSGPAHPDHARFYPGPGVGLGYEDLGVIQSQRFLAAVAESKSYDPGFLQALAVAEVQRACERSAESQAWTTVDTVPAQARL